MVTDPYLDSPVITSLQKTFSGGNECVQDPEAMWIPK